MPKLEEPEDFIIASMIKKEKEDKEIYDKHRDQLKGSSREFFLVDAPKVESKDADLSANESTASDSASETHSKASLPLKKRRYMAAISESKSDVDDDSSSDKPLDTSTEDILTKDLEPTKDDIDSTTSAVFSSQSTIDSTSDIPDIPPPPQFGSIGTSWPPADMDDVEMSVPDKQSSTSTSLSDSTPTSTSSNANSSNIINDELKADSSTKVDPPSSQTESTETTKADETGKESNTSQHGDVDHRIPRKRAPAADKVEPTKHLDDGPQRPDVGTRLPPIGLLNSDGPPMPGQRRRTPPEGFSRGRPGRGMPMRGRGSRGGRMMRGERGRPMHVEDEQRLQQMMKQEQKEREWEEQLHQQLERERWEEERRRRGGPPGLRRRGGHRFPPGGPPGGRWSPPPGNGRGPPIRGPDGRMMQRGGGMRRLPPRDPDGRLMEPGYRPGGPPPGNHLPPHRDDRPPRGPTNFPLPRGGSPPRNHMRPPNDWEGQSHPDGPPADYRPPFHPAAPPQQHPYDPDFPSHTVPPPAPTQQQQQVNVNKLLTDLLSMGIIPGNTKPVTTTTAAPVVKTEPATDVPIVTSSQDAPPTITVASTNSASSVPTIVIPEKTPEVVVPVTKVEVKEEAVVRRSPSPFDEDLIIALDPDANLPVVTFDSDLKERHEEIIKRLYTGIQCSACGFRFTTRQTDLYAEHLDWHYRLNRKEKEIGVVQHREIYPTAGEWICAEDDEAAMEPKNPFGEEEEEEGPETAAFDVDSTVPLTGTPGEDVCAVCKEPFDTFYNEAEDEWQFGNCMKFEGRNIHPSCYDDRALIGPQTPIKIEPYQPMYERADDGIPGLDTIKEEASVVVDSKASDEDTAAVKSDVVTTQDSDKEEITTTNAAAPKCEPMESDDIPLQPPPVVKSEPVEVDETGDSAVDPQVKSEPTDRDVSGTPPFVSDPNVQVECGAGDSPNVVAPSTNDSSSGEAMQVDQFPVKTEPVPTEESSPLASSANSENSEESMNEEQQNLPEETTTAAPLPVIKTEAE